jgi:hypothetical protein
MSLEKVKKYIEGSGIEWNISVSVIIILNYLTRIINVIKLNLEYVSGASNEELAWKQIHVISRHQSRGHCNNLRTEIYY